jgi:hypothetical protein
MKKALMAAVIAAIVATLCALAPGSILQAQSRELLLLCTSSDGTAHFNMRVNLATSALYFYFQGEQGMRYNATIARDYIEYGANG